MEPGAAVQPEFVDRDGVVDGLLERARRASRGDPQLALVVGEVGTGKSTLLENLHARHEGDHSLQLLRAQCEISMSGQSTVMPLKPFKTILEQLVGVCGDDLDPNPRLSARGLRHGLHALVNLGPELIGALIPPAGLLLGAARYVADRKGMVDRINSASTQQLKRDDDFTGLAIDRIASVITSVSREEPIAIAIDDLHWADEHTVALLGQLGRRIVQNQLSGCKLFVFGTYRPRTVVVSGTDSVTASPARMDGLSVELSRYAADAFLINLDEVTESNRVTFCSRILDQRNNDIGLDFRTVLSERTGGNPFFVVQLLSMMLAEGELAVELGRLVIARPVVWGNIPWTIKAALRRRVAGLDEAGREILEAASVCGATFRIDDVARMVEQPTRDVIRTVDTTLARDFALVQPAPSEQHLGPDTVAYQFTHVLFREHFYRHMGTATRVHLHDSLRRVLEGDPARAQANPLVVALHATEAEDLPTGIRWTLVAANQAFGRQEMLHAIDMIAPVLRDDETASRFERKVVEDVIELHLLTAAAKIRLYAASDARGHATSAKLLSQHITNMELEARSHLELGVIEWKSRRYEEAESALRDALALASSLGLADLEAKVHANLGTVYNRTRRVAAALAEYELAERGPDPKVRRQARNNRAVVLGSVFGHYDQAIAIYEQCRQDAEDRGDRSSKLFYLRNLNAHRRVGKYQDARERQLEAIALARDLGEVAAEATSVVYLATTELVRSGPKAALKLYRDALQRIDEARNLGVERAVVKAEALSRAAFCLLLLRQDREAHTMSSDALSLTRDENITEERNVGTTGLIYGLTLLALTQTTGRPLPRAREVFEREDNDAHRWPRDYWAPQYNRVLANLGLASLESDRADLLRHCFELLDEALDYCDWPGIRDEMTLYLDGFERFLQPGEVDALRARLSR